MITEDYVSFETAKLLKEKGFDWECFGYYVDDEPDDVKYSSLCETNSIWESRCCSAPTIQMAMKWLREEHNAMISPYALSLGWYFEIFDLTERDITGCKPLYKVGIPNKEEVLSAYEQACDAAIRYYIENIMQNK